MYPTLEALAFGEGTVLLDQLLVCRASGSQLAHVSTCLGFADPDRSPIVRLQLDHRAYRLICLDAVRAADCHREFAHIAIARCSLIRAVRLVAFIEHVRDHRMVGPSNAFGHPGDAGPPSGDVGLVTARLAVMGGQRRIRDHVVEHTQRVTLQALERSVFPGHLVLGSPSCSPGGGLAIVLLGGADDGALRSRSHRHRPALRPTADRTASPPPDLGGSATGPRQTVRLGKPEYQHS